MNCRLLLGFFAVGLLFVRPALAIDAYNNFGPGDTYDASTGHGIDGGDFAPFTPRISGSRFESAATGQLAVIRIALHHVFHAPPGVNLVDIRLHATDAAGELGPVIASFTRSGLPDFGTLDPPETIVNSDPAVILTAGTRYWIMVAPGDSTTQAVWNWNTTGAADRFATSTNFGLSYSYFENRVGALRVELISIPEPATLTAIAIGLAALACWRRRKR
jgi:hypothetical protein